MALTQAKWCTEVLTQPGANQTGASQPDNVPAIKIFLTRAW